MANSACLVVDDTKVLLTSANFTEAAQDESKKSDPALASAIERSLADRTRAFMLSRVRREFAGASRHSISRSLRQHGIDKRQLLEEAEHSLSMEG